jgi:dihydropteroate synthase
MSGDDRAAAWVFQGGSLTLDRPRVMGIVNVTPDSFSDGGLHAGSAEAVAHGVRLVEEEGADLLDIGGESTRPQGAQRVAAEEELRRVLPVIEGLVRRLPGTPLAVDTTKSVVARAALAAGAVIVNDVSAFRLDPLMGEICAAAGAGVVLMHSRGDVHDMATYTHATYPGGVVDTVRAELAARLAAARASGIALSAIVLDPGLGFGKRSEHSLALLAGLRQLASLGAPLLVGASRKRFVGELSGEDDPSRRVHGTVGANVAALERGARIFRVHDVRASRQALDVAWAVAMAGASTGTEVHA